MTAPPNPPQPLLRLSANHLRPADETDGLGKVLGGPPPTSRQVRGMRLEAQAVRPDQQMASVGQVPESAGDQLDRKGLEIELGDGTTRRFVVGDRENVLETLRALGLPTG
jgi:hypothetical protein